jgi:hypothetical protein
MRSEGGVARLHEVAHFLRWRTIALRYARRLTGRRPPRHLPPRTATVARVRSEGYDVGPRVPAPLLEQILEQYRPRAAQVIARDSGHPFVNLFRADDISAANPVLRLAFSPPVLDVVDDYFGGRFVLDSLQVLYSFPTGGELRESQMWHKDYGDSRSIHWIAYLNDVTGPEDGPFTFIDKRDSRRIARSAFIRRIPDHEFRKELGNGELRQFLGAPGESVYVDPAACYHSGSRCRNPRLALFVTFNSDRPFFAPTASIRENRMRFLEAARGVRADLNVDYLKRLLQL